MSLDISPKTEARLVARAQELGLSVDALLEWLLNDTCDLKASAAGGQAPKLPVWRYLGVRGSLHRRDIYGD
jgi:hypothetical protein